MNHMVDGDYFVKSDAKTKATGYDSDSSESPNKRSLNTTVISINEQNKDIFR